MEELKPLVIKARSGDLKAFEEIVRRFQDMAHGYAYSILGDFHLAEDAAQEAFLDAYHQLPNLRNPEAFSSWFRRIVFKHCDRITRDKHIQTVSIDVTNVMIEETPTNTRRSLMITRLKRRYLEPFEPYQNETARLPHSFTSTVIHRKRLVSFLKCP